MVDMWSEELKNAIKLFDEEPCMENWVNCQIIEWKYARKDVLEYIYSILYQDSIHESEPVRDFFRAGYCYYFANLLQDKFPRGHVRWWKDYSHMVWQDDNGMLYDIEGVFYDWDEDDEFVDPWKTLSKEDLDSFKHTDEYSTPESFEKSFLRETCDGELNKEGLIRYFKQTNYQHFARIMHLAFGGTIVKENDMFFWVSEDGEKYNPKIFV